MRNIRSSHSLTVRAALACAFLALPLSGYAAFELPAGFLGQKITNLRLPLKRHENGRVKEFLQADEASIGTDGRYYADGNLRFILLAEDGSTNGVAYAEHAVFNPQDNSAVCEGPVYFSLDTKNVTLTGTNLTWKSSRNIACIETNAVLRLYRTGNSVVDAFHKKETK